MENWLYNRSLSNGTYIRHHTIPSHRRYFIEIHCVEWKMFTWNVYQSSSVHLLSHVQLCTPWTAAARQASLSITNWNVYSFFNFHNVNTPGWEPLTLKYRKISMKSRKIFMLLPWHCDPKNHYSEFYEQR